jgi:hypothetical protein
VNRIEETMDQQHKAASSATGVESSTTFSEAEYSSDPGRVIAHAAATGTAVVVRADGKPRVIINIPTVDLPVFDD